MHPLATKCCLVSENVLVHGDTAHCNVCGQQFGASYMKGLRRRRARQRKIRNTGFDQLFAEWMRLSEQCDTPEERYFLLKRFSHRRCRGAKYAKERRAAFSRWKYVVFPRVERHVCWCCWAGMAKHRHHVVQLQNGGRNIPENIVPLCEHCHKMIHPWLEVETA